jgi:hypothetical protein
MIDSAGGVSVGAALAQSRANVEALRERALTIVETQISALDAVSPPTSLDDTAARLDRVYRAATELIDAAGPFELNDLCQAAGGLCDLIGAVEPDEAFDWRIVVVHARSLRLLHSLPAEAVEERARILESLGEVIERKRAQSG